MINHCSSLLKEARYPTSYYPSLHFEVVFLQAQSASNFHVILACLVLFVLVIEFAELLECVDFCLPSNTCPRSPLEVGRLPIGNDGSHQD